jgi:hypothetical protein
MTERRLEEVERRRRILVDSVIDVCYAIAQYFEALQEAEETNGADDDNSQGEDMPE